MGPLEIVSWVLGIISLICYVLVLIQMFQHGKTGLAIACIVLLFCCGIGALIVFIYGWMNAKQWNFSNIMTIWTICFVVNLVLGGLNFSVYQARYQQMMPH
jgi:hypothetical protein